MHDISNFVLSCIPLLLQNLKVPVPEEISVDLGKIILIYFFVYTRPSQVSKLASSIVGSKHKAVLYDKGMLWPTASFSRWKMRFVAFRLSHGRP